MTHLHRVFSIENSASNILYKIHVSLQTINFLVRFFKCSNVIEEGVGVGLFDGESVRNFHADSSPAA